MRWYSTNESSRAGEPTVLAVLESTAAMGCSIWAGVYFDTWMHVVVGACIAPFMLLRTDESCIKAIYGMNLYVEFAFFRERTNIAARAIALFGMPCACVVALSCRFTSAAIEFATNYRRALANVPSNWWRQVFATDFVSSPEWMPLPTETSGPQQIANWHTIAYVYNSWGVFASSVRQLYALSLWLGIIATIMVAVPFLTLSTFTAFVFRWSLKSTAIVWFPLLWALQPVKRTDQSWRTYLDIQRTLRKPQFVAAVSAIILAFMSLKGLLWIGRHELAMHSEAWRELFISRGWDASTGSLADVVAGFVRPGAIPLWQFASGANAILGILAWWKIREWLAHYQHGDPPADDAITRRLHFTTGIRRLLTSYAVICNVYIFWQAARKLPMPEIGNSLFPFV